MTIEPLFDSTSHKMSETVFYTSSTDPFSLGQKRIEIEDTLKDAMRKIILRKLSQKKNVFVMDKELQIGGDSIVEDMNLGDDVPVFVFNNFRERDYTAFATLQ